MRNKCLMILCALFLGVSISFAQDSVPAPTPTVEDPREMIRERQQTIVLMEALRGVGDSGGLARADLIANSENDISLSKRDKELISIKSEDEEKYSDFLKQSKTGFTRLHDSSRCNESRNVINANSPCPWGVTGKATAFSFRKQIYTVSVFSDLQNSADLFQIAGINQLGFLSNLGDVALDSLNLQSPGIKSMADFQASNDVKEIQFQYNLAKNGFQVGDYIYKSDLPINVNQTYVLRSIAYDGKAYRTFGEDKIDIFEGDERKDIIVVFRVIRKYEDGSYSILWKELRRETSPTIVEGK